MNKKLTAVVLILNHNKTAGKREREMIPHCITLNIFTHFNVNINPQDPLPTISLYNGVRSLYYTDPHCKLGEPVFIYFFIFLF